MSWIWLNKIFWIKLPSSKGLTNKYDCAYYSGNRKSWFWDWEYLVESLGKQILDRACTKTISSEKWINEYIENLNEEDKKKVVCSEKESKSLFRFGGGIESKTVHRFGGGCIKTVNIPINILLLISKCPLSKLGMKVDFTRHDARVNSQVIKLQSNSCGHYCVH